MMQLLKIEWLKIKNYKTFWILLILFIISIFGLNTIVYQFNNEIERTSKGMTNMLLGTPYKFPDVWQAVSYVSSFLLFFPGLLMIINLTNEYSYKTHRQNIIDGWSRTQFIMAKMLIGLGLALVSTIFVFLSTLLFGFIKGGEFSFHKIEYIGYFFIQAISYVGVAIVFSLLFRRSGLTIGIYFLYTVILENFLSFILKYFFGKVGCFLPLESTDSLIQFPIARQVSGNQFFEYPSAVFLLIAASVYLVFYFVFNKWKFEKSDL